DSDSRAHLRLQILDALYARADTAIAGAAARELESKTIGAALADGSADACVLAEWRLFQRDTATVQATIALLRADSAAQPAPVAPAPLVCADLLQAWLAVTLRQPSALAEVQRVDSLVLNTSAAGDAQTYAHLVIGRLYRRLGEPRAAWEALRRRPYLSGWPRYLAATLRTEAELAVELGQDADALEAYRKYLALRDDPEPQLIPEVERVRENVARLGSRSAALRSQ
ncbi:MAG TPA: hypothetical protein VK864_00880, partial [Longimicrobiales bacterium]|nr:hypothetical protein [Longimicrobiales bacterium]